MAADNSPVEMGLLDWDTFSMPYKPAEPQIEAQAPTPEGVVDNKEARKQKIRSALQGMADARPAPMQPLLQLPDVGTPQQRQVNFLED
jgi:hypothetical protein